MLRRIVSFVVTGAFLLNSVIPVYALRTKATDEQQETPAEIAAEILGVSGRISTKLEVPEGQGERFFSNDYHSYVLSGVLRDGLKLIPKAVVNEIKKKLNEDVAEGRLLSAEVRDFGAAEIDIHVTHRWGERNAIVQRLILAGMHAGLLKAEELGLLKKNVDIASMKPDELGKTLRVKRAPHSITERDSEPVVIAKYIGAGIGAAGIKLYNEFFMPGSTPLQKLGFVTKGKKGVRGFRVVVRRTEDVMNGNFDGPVWEFENSTDFEVSNPDDKDHGKKYVGKNQHLEFMALASQPNDFLPTEVYAVEGSGLSSTEPLVTLVYQPVYAEEGGLRALNPTFIHRSQSGADAVAGVASIHYNVNVVPGGFNGEYFVPTRPATLQQARRAPKEGTANVVVYGYQSELNGVIPREKGEVIDHVAINPPALNPKKALADFLASVLLTHKHDQPYLAPFAAEERVAPIREAHSDLFTHAPKEADIDTVMDAVEAKVADGSFVSVTDDKADMGGMFGHNFTPQYMLAIDRATLMYAAEKGELSDGNITGFIDKGRLKRGITVSIGDDSHLLMVGDKSRNSANGHQLSFLAFTRGYLASVVGNTTKFDPTKKLDADEISRVGKKPYGRAQDYQGKEAKAAKANPYFYSHFDERFFEILRDVMPQDYLQMVDNMEAGWRHWQDTKQETQLIEPFSGNVSQQGIGTARYVVDAKGGERHFGKLAGDKMGPAGINRPIREGVYDLVKALEAGTVSVPDYITDKAERAFYKKFIEELKNGLVFEIWDAKAFDEHGNIPLNKLPSHFADVADSINELKEEAEKEFVKNSYNADGTLKASLSKADKEKLAALIKKSGYVPTERVFLDAQADKDAIYAYLADSDRFNIKQVWNKNKSGWDINNPQDYLNRPILGSSVTKLGILAGGEYVGKDDPVMVGNTILMEYIFAFVENNPILLQGDMNGSHWLAAIPTAFKYAVANAESHPILVGFRYTLSEDGKELADAEDVFGDKKYNKIRNKMFRFNHEFKIAQLGGQFAPYGTDARTVEASYPLAKLLRDIQSPDSPFLVSNKPAAERAARPIGMGGEVVDLFKVATAQPAAVGFGPGTPHKDQGPDNVAEAWGTLGPVAAEFQPDIYLNMPDAALEVHYYADKTQPILISEEFLKSAPGIMLMYNLMENVGPGNINFVVQLEGEKALAKEERAKLREALSEEIFTIAKANYISMDRSVVNNIITAVVTGTDANNIANQVIEEVGNDIVQVIGDAAYTDKFKGIVKTRIVLDKADGQFMQWAKALKLAVNLTPEAGDLSAEDVKQLDAAFSKDDDGNYHVAATSLAAGSEVATILSNYAALVETAIKI